MVNLVFLVPMTLQAIQKQVDQWIKEVGHGYYSVLTNLGVLCEEVGELARVLVRIYGEQTPKEGEELNLEEEFADILFVLCALANQTGVDLQQAFYRKMEKRTERDRERWHRKGKQQNL